MKNRITALFLIVTMLLSVSISAAGAFTPCKVTSLKADTSSALIGKQHIVRFTAETEGRAASKLQVLDADANCVAYLYDADADGIYTGEAKLAESQIGTQRYSIAGSDSVCDIKFYRTLTDSDWAEHDAIWAQLNSIEAEYKSVNAADSDILAAVFAYLEKQPEVSRVWYETEEIINFELVSGIGNIYTLADEDFKSSAAEYVDFAEKLVESREGNDFIDDADIGVWSPYYGYDSSFSYNYLDRAEACADTAGGIVEGFYGADASYESFKTWDQYGVIMVDSHGTIYGGDSCICVPAPGQYDQQDIAEGHIYSMGGGEIAITGSFFLKHCPGMPNTLIYMGICLGMATTALCDPLIEAGAAFMAGYTTSVTFRYDGLMMDSIFEHLCTDNPETGDLYTAEQACLAAQAINGGIDPWGDAVLIWAGNPNITMMYNPIPAEAVTLNPASMDLYINNTVTLEPQIAPIDANRYTITWESSDDSIATVDELGAVTAHNTGTATITCTVTNDVGENTSSVSAEAQINVLGIMDASGIIFDTTPIVVGLGNTSVIMTANAAPLNASNQNIIWHTADESIATIDEDGRITPVSVGSTAIIAETEDGGFTLGCVCTVLAGDLNPALNHSNFSLNFVNDETNPWILDSESDPERVSAMSNIAGMNGASSTFGLDLEDLEVGDALSFDWMVSSEQNYDKLTFYVNGTREANLSGDVNWHTFTYTVESAGDYSFTWEYDKDSTTHGGEDLARVDEVILTRVNMPEDITLTYLDSDGSMLYEVEVPYGSEIINPGSPYTEGMTFVGWDKSGAVDCDTIITAVYVEGELNPGANMHTVSFVANTNIISRIFIESGSALEDVCYPVAEFVENALGSEFIFIGWSEAPESITEDTTIEALCAMMNDVNGNLTVDSGDASMVLRMTVGLMEISELATLTGDYNASGELDTGDAAGILRITVGLE